MTTCKAAVFVGANKPLEVQEFPVLPMEPGGALVQMQMAAICGTDVHAWHLDATPAPMIFGTRERWRHRRDIAGDRDGRAR